MSVLMIADYLRTQGLRLPVDAVQVAHLAAQTVIHMGKAEIERNLLWSVDESGWRLSDCVAENEDSHVLLRQMYLALDSLLSRFPSQSAAVYLHLPLAAERHGGQLVRLVGQGQPLEAVLPVDEAACWQHIASRSAQTGWLNQIDDVAHCLASGELQGEQHQRCQSQMALPLYGDNGRVLGVIYVEDGQTAAFDNERQIYWIGLALALVPLLQQLHTQWQNTSEEKHHE